MSLDIGAMLREFHKKYAPVTEPLYGTAHSTRRMLLAEECHEYEYAESQRDLIGVADALGDIVYVCYGTAFCYGIDLDAVITEIHRSNMTKDQPVKPGGKAIKGTGYRPPDIYGVLARHRPPDIYGVFARKPDKYPDKYPVKYPVFTICGSMRYYKAMLVIAQTETERGSIILMPFITKPANETKKEMLDDMHKRKIDMSDGIIIVGSYIGESTQAEWDYAREHGKSVVRYATVDHLL